MRTNNLWDKIKRGDKKAFETLFNNNYNTLSSYICTYTKSQSIAEDIAQETFIKLWINRNTIEIQTSLKAYLFRSAYNMYIDSYRIKKQNSVLLENIRYQILQEQFINSNDDILDKKIEKIKHLIQLLPNQCRKILLLSKEKGYKNREIAVKLNISIKTVESQIRIAYDKIRHGFK